MQFCWLNRSKQSTFSQKVLKGHSSVQFSSVQSLSCVWFFVTPWTVAHQPPPPIYHQCLEFTQTHVHWVTDTIQPSHPLSSPSPTFNLSQHQGLLWNESVLHIRWPKYWSFSLSISPSSGYSGLISFRMDWVDLLAVQGTLKSLLQHHSSKASVLQCSAFFIVQLSHPYMTTGKTIALTRWTFVGKVVSQRSQHSLTRASLSHLWTSFAWLYFIIH